MIDVSNFLIKEEKVYPGALSCRGCGWALLVRHLAEVLGEKAVYVVPASCFSIISGPFPLSELKGSVIHTVFAAASATATGARVALDRQGKKDTPVVVLAGDGGTFDIGFQAMSGAAARNENILYIVNNNGAYMNTGIQSSTATPYGAATTTNPGAKGFKKTFPKDLMGIIAAHNVQYAATISMAYLQDMKDKMEKAANMEGFRLLMIDGPCPPGHKVDPANSIKVSRLAVESTLYPLYEVRHMKYKISYKPREIIPVEECLKYQGRFKHVFKRGNEKMLAKIQEYANAYWKRLNLLEEIYPEEEFHL